MNREEFIERLEKLGLPKDDFCVLSGGSLLLNGIREKTNDVDISIKKILAEKSGLYEMKRDEYGLYLFQPDVQCKDDFEKIDKVKIDGFWCESLESVLAFKKRMRRPKDLVDIEAIEKRLNG